MGNSFKTYLKHTYKDFKNRSVNPPLVRTSTMVFKSMKDLRQTQKKNLKNPKGGYFESVSYTHLTLPTNREV